MIYAPEPSKEGLFRAVLDRYGDDRQPVMAHVIAAPTAREAAERSLRGAADMASDSDKPPGCLLMQAGAYGAGEARAVADELSRRRREVIQVLGDRFEQARSQGDLFAGADPTALAAYLAAIAHGIGVQAASGVEAATLRQVVEVALAGLAAATPARTPMLASQP